MKIRALLKRVAVLSCLATLSSACVSNLSAAGRSVRAADEKMVVQCAFVSDETHASKLHGWRTEDGIEDGKNQIRNRAAQLEVVFTLGSNVEGPQISAEVCCSA